MTFISKKMGLLNIIQEQSESILMNHFLRNRLAKEIQLIGQHVHLSKPQWIFFLGGEYSWTKFIVESQEVWVIQKITSKLQFKLWMNKETCAQMFVEVREG